MCNTLNRSDDGNLYFDETISMVDLTTVHNTCDFDLYLKIKFILQDSENYFTENVLISLSGYIVCSIMEKKSLTLPGAYWRFSPGGCTLAEYYFCAPP